MGRWGLSSNLSGLQNKEERVQIVPSFPACSKAGENCMNTGCCQVSGHKCFSKGKGKAQCNKTCTAGVKGFTCDVINPHSVPVATPRGQNLYCFSAYTENTGNESLVNHELELLNIVAARGAGLFACEQWDVFSDVSAPLVNGYVTIKVEDTFGEFHQLKRKDSGTWVNWGMFYQVWVKIREVGKWQTADYTVKIDADAVFVPQRLRTWLSSKPGESPHGLYYENCPNVQYGFFGHLEIISKTAVEVLTQYLEDCHAVFAPCANDGCDWKYGAWGEDVFAQRCMDHHYVDKVEAFDVATDGACAADRPKGEKNKKWHPTDCSSLTTVTAHPLKSLPPSKSAWMRCPRGLLQGTWSPASAVSCCAVVSVFSHAPSSAGECSSPCLFSLLPPSSYPPPCMLHVDALRRCRLQQAAVANRRCACIGRC